MRIERKRFVVMRKNRTEIWGGCARHYYFKHIDDVGDFAIKTYRTEKQAMASCSSWDRDFEVVPIVETITDERTGLLIANMAWLKDNWEKFLESEKKFPDIKTYTLAVRNCNEAEIERLNHIVDVNKKVKAEAVKEFADNLKATFPPIDDLRCTDDDIYTLNLIDDLVKEFTEGKADE